MGKLLKNLKVDLHAIGSRGDKERKRQCGSGLTRKEVKKDGVVIVNKPHLLKMLPTLYQNHFQKHLKKSESLTLELLIGLVQTHKQVSVEQLATLMPYPIKFESLRRNIQRFLKLDSLQIESLWFPLLKIIIKEKLKAKSPLKITLDRTQWRDKNVFMVSLI